MLPTFKPGQVLYIHPEGNTPRPGDVVVYRFRDSYVVHRVKAIKGGELITRGDNNLYEDTPVKFNQVIGVVEKKEDKGKIENIRVNWMALLIVRLRWVLRQFFKRMLPWLGAPYRWLKASKLVSHFWHPRVTILRVQSPFSDVVKYIVRGKTVATWQQKEARFQYKRPYDLIICPPKKAIK